MIEVNFNFNELRCIHQYDGGSASEPYMWFVFFYVDSSTLSSSQGLVATRNMMDNVSGRQIFQGGVRPGKIIPIPESLGRARILLDDAVLQRPVVGVVYAVLEKNGTTDSLMQAGHRVFGQAFHEEINEYVRGHLPDPPPLSVEERQAMAQRIQDRVFAAVRAGADFYEYFRSKDRVIGFTSEYFPWPALTLLRDSTPGQPYPIPQIIRHESTVWDGTRWVQYVDEYEVRGSIQVSPYTPPPPDPCQAERAACNRAAAALERLDEAIANLKTQYAQAPASQKPGIRAEIQEAEAERAQALAEAQRAQEAYDECRARNPIRSKAFTF